MWQAAKTSQIWKETIPPNRAGYRNFLEHRRPPVIPRAAFPLGVAVRGEELLNALAFGSKSADDLAKSHFVDAAQRRCAQAEGDKTVLLCKPEAFLFQVRLESAGRNSSYFKTDPLLLLGDPAQRIGSSRYRYFSGHLASFGHDYLLEDH